jgi:hypothetical protein
MRIGRLVAEARAETAERNYHALWAQDNQRVEAAEARAEAMRAALVKVEAYFASEESPLYSLWEDGDICYYDYNPCTFWNEVLDQLQDCRIPVGSLGYGVEWPAVTLYREVLAALAPEAKDICPRCGSLLGYDSHLEQTGETKQEVVIDNAVCPRCEWQSPPIAAIADEREEEK